MRSPLKLYTFRVSFRQRVKRQVVRASSPQAALLGLGLLDDEVSKTIPCSPMERLVALQRPNRREKVLWYESLGVLLDRGATMTAALRASNRLAMTPAFRGAVGEITERFQQRGEKLHLAMSLRTDVFSVVERTLLEAGDRSGELPKVLKELSSVGLSEMKMMKKLLGALAYPGLILILGIIVFLVVAIYLIPEFARTFTYLGAELPMFTQIILNVSAWLSNYWLVALFVSTGGVLILHKVFQRETVRNLIQEGLFRCPLIGKLYHGMILGRCLKTLSLLLDCGVSHEKSYELVQRVADQQRYTTFFQRISRRILRGERIDRSFMAEREAVGSLGEELTGRIAAGQSIGDPLAILPGLIQDIDDHVSHWMDILPKPLGAIALIGVALLVGLIMAAVFIPNLSLALQLLER